MSETTITIGTIWVLRPDEHSSISTEGQHAFVISKRNDLSKFDHMTMREFTAHDYVRRLTGDGVSTWGDLMPTAHRLMGLLDKYNYMVVDEAATDELRIKLNGRQQFRGTTFPLLDEVPNASVRLDDGSMSINPVISNPRQQQLAGMLERVYQIIHTKPNGADAKWNPGQKPVEEV